MFAYQDCGFYFHNSLCTMDIGSGSSKLANLSNYNGLFTISKDFLQLCGCAKFLFMSVPNFGWRRDATSALNFDLRRINISSLGDGMIFRST